MYKKGLDLADFSWNENVNGIQSKIFERIGGYWLPVVAKYVCIPGLLKIKSCVIRL